MPTISKRKSGKPIKRNYTPASTPEGRENQLTALAYDRAEEMLLDGTASSQVVTFFLKLGSTKQRLEMEKLREENELLRAKTSNIKSQERSEQKFDEVIAAIKTYRGE